MLTAQELARQSALVSDAAETLDMVGQAELERAARVLTSEEEARDLNGNRVGEWTVTK